MGAFFITPKRTNSNTESALSHFQQKGFKKPFFIETDSHIIHLFNKIGIDKDMIFRVGDDFVFMAGTAIYKDSSFDETLSSILFDYKNNKLDHLELRGNFALIFYLDSNISIVLDASRIFNVYYDKDSNIYSSSFNAIVASISEPRALNKLFLEELIVTGTSPSSNTMVDGIFRINHPLQINQNLGGIDLEFIPRKRNVQHQKSFKDSVGFQHQVNTEYHHKIKKFSDEFGGDLGLSAGYDSRLELGYMDSCFENYGVHTHWKPKDDIEITLAKKMANCVSRNLVQVPITTTEMMKEADIVENMEASFQFYDGQVRLNHGWTREYRTLNYRKAVLGENKFGISGIGGEQYRNSQNLAWGKYNFNAWIKEYVIGEQAAGCYSPDKLEVLIERLKTQITAQLGIKSSNTITFLETKRYINEIWVTNGPGYRNSCENQFAFFISPFTDAYLQECSYAAIPFLGISGKFEGEMIERISPKLAAMPSSYGNFPISKPTVTSVLKNYIVFSMPFAFRNIARNLRRKKKGVHFTLKRFPTLYEYVNQVKKLNLPFDIDYLLSFQHEMDRIIAVGYFIKKFEDRIRI